MPDESNVLPLAEEGANSFDAWKKRILAAEDKRDTYKSEWDKHIADYLVTIPSQPTADTVVVPKHFSLVEQKKPKLFYQTPEVTLKPKRPEFAGAVPLFGSVLNHYLGTHGVDAKALMGEVTFDALMTGLLCSKIGYENVIDGVRQVQVGTAPAPVQETPQPGAVLGLNPSPLAPPVPIYEDVPNVVWERYFWERISPAKVLIPEGFHGSDYHKAPWVGFEFLIDRESAIRQGWIDAEWTGKTVEDEHRLGLESKRGTAQDDQIRGWELWYRAAYFDATVKHPERQRRLVMLEGVETPVVHEDSRYQREDEFGKLVGVVKRFPVHLGAIRYVSDSAYPPADCHTTMNMVGELSKFRSTMITQRNTSVPMRAADLNRLTPEQQAMVSRGVWQGVLLVDGPPDNIFTEVARANYPRENYTANDYCDRDISEAWALGPNQRGMDNEESKTATELSLAQRSSNERMAAEQLAVLRYFVAGAEILGSLIQMFADEEDYIEIEGPDGAKALTAWDKTKIAGEFVYEVKPNGAQRIDAEQEKREALNLYNFAAKDPLVNRQELLKKVAQAYGFDPTKFIVQPQPKGPDPMNVSLRVGSEDLNPMTPQFPLVISVLEQAGFKIDPAKVQEAKARAGAQILAGVGMPTAGGVPTAPPGAARPSLEHGGMSDKTELLNKHQEERTGAMKGTGASL